MTSFLDLNEFQISHLHYFCRVINLIIHPMAKKNLVVVDMLRYPLFRSDKDIVVNQDIGVRSGGSIKADLTQERI